MKFVLYFICFFTLISSANALIVSEENVIKAIAKEADNDSLSFEIFAGQTSFEVENAKNFKLLVSNLQLDELQNKFSCSVEVFIDNKAYATTQIMGRYATLVEVYVPSKNINKGEIAKSDLLHKIKVKSSKVKPIHLIDKDKIIGKMAKKTLQESRLITDKDVGKIILIKKNDLITVLYRTKQMQIAIKAIALEDAGFEDKIEVMNTTSKKTMFGKVFNKDTVVIEGEQ